MWFWLKISICQISVVHGKRSVNCPKRAGSLEASTVCWRKATRPVQLSRNQAAVDRVRPSSSSGGPSAQSGGLAKKASVSSLDFAWNCHSLFKCRGPIQKKIIHCEWSPAHMLQTMSCSTVVWSHQSYLLINNLIVCNYNKYYYCSIVNCKLNNKKVN